MGLYSYRWVMIWMYMVTGGWRYGWVYLLVGGDMGGYIVTGGW